MTVAGALGAIVRHPVRFLATRWNWKAALFSTLLRGGVFFAGALDVGLAAAARALVVDMLFRVPLAGTCAGIIQEVRRAEPAWAAAAVAALAVPSVSHAVEITAHRAASTPLLSRSVAFSLALSVVSSAIELLLMRHDIMIVGPDSRTLLGDVRRLIGAER